MRNLSDARNVLSREAFSQIALVPTQIFLYLCMFYSSKSAEDCNAHMATHDAEPRYQCEADNCDFSCRSMTTFKKHFKSAHLMENGPIYCCHLCDKKYNRGPCLGNHLRKMHKLEHPPGHTRFRYSFTLRI